MQNRILIASPAPVLNTPDFSSVFGGLAIPTNDKGHPLHFEFVALPGMTCFVTKQSSQWIAQVTCPHYPGDNLFLDLRFAKAWEPLPPMSLPSKEEILKQMHSLLGTPYVWGGNWSTGIPKLLELYPPQGSLSPRMKTLWTLSGIDCSGLLFQTTRGLTPRNTSQLIRFGIGLKINNLKVHELERMVEPLDMILYRGHVLYVLNATTTIESKSPYGVILRDLRERLEEIGQGRVGQDEWDSACSTDSQFIIRRPFSV